MSATLRKSCCADGEPADPATGCCGFPDEDWLLRYRTYHEANLPRTVFLAGRLHLNRPASDVREECSRLMSLQAARTPAHEQLIREQAGNADQTLLPQWSVLQLLHLYNQPGPHRALTDVINQNITKAAFRFKRCFMRVRPFRVCGNLNPLFSKSDGYYPGHPSYPSAHATLAYTWAYLFSGKLASKHRHFKPYLLLAAKGVAENREWAGVHFASDTIAGESLGKQIAEAILSGGELSDDEFEMLMPGLT